MREDGKREGNEGQGNMRDRLAAETPKKRETRQQQMSTNQHERLAVETPKERARKITQETRTNQHERREN